LEIREDKIIADFSKNIAWERKKRIYNISTQRGSNAFNFYTLRETRLWL
jgi:hypothetical protein